MGLLKKLFKRPIAVCMVCIVCFVFGIMATMNMPTNLLPNISFPALGITVPYPGASAETCDEDVRPLMENTVKTLSGVKSVTSYCIEHASVSLVMFDYGTDLDKKTEEIKDKLALVQFPTACYEPVFTQVDFNGMAVATVTVANPEDVTAGYADAEELKNRFLAIENVGSVSVMGSPEREITITPTNGLEIATLLIVQALTVNSQLDIPLGSLEENGDTVAYRNASSAETIEDIKNTPFQLPITFELGNAMTTAQSLIEYVQATPSADMQATRDELREYFDTLMNIEVSTGAELLAELEATIPLDTIISILYQVGLSEFADTIDLLYTYLKENPNVLKPFSEKIANAQAEAKETFNDEFWASFEAVITFKQSHEYLNPITNELVADELTSANFKELVEIIGVEFPLTVTEELIDFIRAKDFSNLTYDADGNANLNLYVKDVATVTETLSYSSKSYKDGVEAVTLLVYGISGANTTAISENVRAVIEKSDDLESELFLVDDQAQFINDSIANVLDSMLIGGLLAVLVIFLFLRRVRTSLIIAITMPLSILCSLICMYFLGITLNMVSLGGLAVGIGMLVDNSIVVIESITFERDKGKTALQAAIDGTKLVAGSLVASTLTSICVFFPILFTEGLTEMIFADMAYAVIFSLTFSLIVAITVIPTLYCTVYSDSLMLKGGVFEKLAKKLHRKEVVESSTESVKTPQNAKKRPFRRGWLTGVYDAFLRICLRRRWLVLLLAFTVFASSVGLVFMTGTEFLPSVDQRTIEVKIDFSASDKLDFCEAQTLILYDELYERLADLKALTVTVGKSGLAATSPSGTIRILLTDQSKPTKQVVNDVRAIADEVGISATVTEVDGVLASLVSGIGGISNISVNITGDDIETLKEISAKVKEKTFAESTYFTQVTDNLTEKSIEYVINIDKMKCLEYGVDYTVAVATLRAGIAGYTACTAEIGEETVDVTIKFKDGTMQDFYGGLANFTIGINGGEAVKLQDISTITPTEIYGIIKKENGKHLATLSAEATGIDSGTASGEFISIVEEVLKDYEGYTFVESGVNYYLSEVFDGLIVALIISFFLLFAVMACQFESLRKPFIVIFAIPLSFTGGFLALTLTGISLNVVSFVGLIMLMGVIVNDAIVMIDRIGQLEAGGLSRYDALIEGSKSRLRAIWMTTLTTVLALIPISLALGKGAELMQPLGVVVIGGLTLGTLVTLVLIPTMYSLINRVPIPKIKKAKPVAIKTASPEKEVAVTKLPTTEIETTLPLPSLPAQTDYNLPYSASEQVSEQPYAEYNSRTPKEKRKKGAIPKKRTFTIAQAEERSRHTIEKKKR